MKEQFQLINAEERNPFEVDERGADSANLEILTVEEDEGSDENLMIHTVKSQI